MSGGVRLILEVHSNKTIAPKSYESDPNPIKAHEIYPYGVWPTHLPPTFIPGLHPGRAVPTKSLAGTSLFHFT